MARALILPSLVRTQLLRIMGWRTDAVEFVSSAHTPRNLLLRAVRGMGAGAGAGAPGGLKLLSEYDDLKAFWGGFTPHLETLLEAELKALRDTL